MGVAPIDSSTAMIASSAGGVPNPSSLAGMPPAVLAYSDAINQAASATGVPARLIASVVTAESCGRADIVNGSHCSSAGAIGAMQLMPATARQLGVDPTKPDQNIMGGARYLAMLIKQYGGDYTRAVRAYNAGPGNENSGKASTFTETRNYQSKVMGLFGGSAAANYPRADIASLKQPQLAKGGWSLGSLFNLKYLFEFTSITSMDEVMDRMQQADPQLFPENAADQLEFRRLLADQLRRENATQMVDATHFKAGAQVRFPPVELPKKPESQFRAFLAAPVTLTPTATVNTAQAPPDPSMGRVYLPPRAV